MVNTPHFDLDIDSTLGGNNASDYVIPSQKAIKDYVDNNTGSTVDQTYDPTSQAAQSGVAIAGAGFLTSASLTNYVTTNTQQTITAQKTFNSRVNFLGTGDANAMYLSLDTRIDVNGTTNTVLGFANGTFLINNPAYNLKLRGKQTRPVYNSDANYIALLSDVPTESTVSGWGFTKNTGTVTSVNNVSPSSGNVTLTASDVGALPDSTTIPSALGDLSNVSISSPTAGQNLTYDAVNQVWKNTSTSATVAWGGITGTLADQTDLANALSDKYDASNPDGYITGITSSDVTTALGYTPYSSANPNGYTSNVGTVTSVNNVNPVNGNVTLSIPSEVTETTVSGWGFTKNTGTVTSVNNVSPVNGNVSLTIPTVNDATLTIQQNGTDVQTFSANASSNVTANITVPTSISDLTDDTSTTPIDKAESVVDNNTGYLKFWSGTKAQYDAITTKDSNTIYNVEDTTSPIISILDSLYPVGSIYIGTMSACPLATLGIGTWQLVAADRVLQGAGTRGNVGTTVNESLPNITGSFGIGRTGWRPANDTSDVISSGLFYTDNTTTNWDAAANYTSGKAPIVKADASRSSSTYQNNAPVQQNAYLVNIWERIS